MPNEAKSKFELPWSTLLPLLAALAGIIAQYMPLVSSRPASPGEKSVEAIAKQDVDARLWQDPLAVARKEKDAHEAEEAKGAIEQETHKVRHSFKALADLIADETKDLSNRVLLLSVMLDAGPYIEQSELRLRSRRAVLEGLNQSGFVPVDSEHIGFITWPLDKKKPDQDRLLIPWEECRASDNPASVRPRDTGRAFILWLPAASFDPFPLRRFASLIGDLIQGIERDKIIVKLIGPTNSNGLQRMIQEARNRLPVQTDPENALDGVTIISPRATVMDEAILSDLLLYDVSGSAPRLVPDVSLGSEGAATERKIESSWNPQLKTAEPGTQLSGFFPIPRNLSVEKTIDQAIAFGQHRGLQFVRTITQDDVVLGKIIEELELRGVEVKKSVEKQGNLDQIVTLTEWDSAYGRLLASTFAALASGHSYREIFQGKYPPPSWIHSYEYLRGIDGRLPGEQSKSSEQKGNLIEQVPTQPKQPKPEEATEGVDQSDYLRRLARELKEEDMIFRREYRGRIRAIGLLGSDIYDKLMILRALRPEFPEAIFFTNNYDAHFERRADWSDAHNLVIASPFGSQLPGWQNVIPFRDSTQTSMFMGTLVATEKLTDRNTLTRLTNQVRVFEIGRHGAYDLNGREKYWFRNWLKFNKLYLGSAALTLMLLIGWLRWGSVDERFPCRATWLSRSKKLLCDTPLWVVCGSVAIILLVCLYAQTPSASQEPLQFFSGISIWPTEMLRLIAVVLSIHFMIRAFITLKLNERRIADEFCLPPRALSTANGVVKSFIGCFSRRLREEFRSFCEAFMFWRTAHVHWRKSGKRFFVEDAWHTYLCRNRFLPRFIRVALLVVLYLAFTESLRGLFLVGRLAFAPARGEAAFRASYYISFGTNICLTVLCFFVLDAILLNGNFIRVLARGLTKWPDGVSVRCKRNPLLSSEDLSRYNDVLLVAERTRVVAQSIWYPLIVLAILIFARSSLFDNWTWPPVIIVTDTLNAALAIGSAFFLRRMAERLRTAAIENLQLRRDANYKDQRKREAFNELLAETRSLKIGAFAPFTEQPFVRAILLPGAGLGIFSVAQRLLEVP